jgi:hypothetical protein
MATTIHLYMFHTYMWLGKTFLASSEDKMYILSSLLAKNVFPSHMYV